MLSQEKGNSLSGTFAWSGLCYLQSSPLEKWNSFQQQFLFLCPFLFSPLGQKRTQLLKDRHILLWWANSVVHKPKVKSSDQTPKFKANAQKEQKPVVIRGTLLLFSNSSGYCWILNVSALQHFHYEVSLFRRTVWNKNKTK